VVLLSLLLLMLPAPQAPRLRLSRTLLPLLLLLGAPRLQLRP
jgi:hypothetical protein